MKESEMGDTYHYHPSLSSSYVKSYYFSSVLTGHLGQNFRRDGQMSEVGFGFWSAHVQWTLTLLRENKCSTVPKINHAMNR